MGNGVQTDARVTPRKNHLSSDSYREEFKHYFPEMSDKELNLVRNPFRCSVDSILDEQQDKLIDLQNDSTAKDFFDDNAVEEF